MIMKQVFLLVSTFLVSLDAQNWLGLGQFGQIQNVPQAQSYDMRPSPATEDTETQYHYPCNGDIFQMARPGGQLNKNTNYWDGRLDLTDYTYLKAIKLVIRVDQAAEITVDPEVGTVSGPKTGKLFRVTFEGSPPDVNEVNFRIKGLQSTLFPNLASLHLNNRDICKNPSVINNLSGTLMNLGNTGTQLTGGLSDTLGLGGLFGSSGNNYNNAARPQQPPSRATTTTTRRPTTTKKASVGTCGKRQVTQSAYITNGWEVRPGDYPWHAALYHKGTR